jgi:predicted PurR-regulated permease PerM
MAEFASAVRADERKRTAPSPSPPPPDWHTAFRSRSDVRTVALVIIAIAVSCFALHEAAAFLIPLAVSLVASYALSPVVDQLERWRLPRSIGAAVVVLILIVGAAMAFHRLWDGVDALLSQLPAAVEKLRLGILLSQGDGSMWTHVQRTASELTRLAGAATPPGEAPAGPPPAWALDARSLLLMGTGSVLAGTGQLLSIVFLTYFLLAAGDLFRRKLVRVIGPPIARQKATLEVLNRIHDLNQRYLAVTAFVNVLLGTATALGLALVGLEHAAIWGVAIAVLHFIPYLGAAVIAAGVAIAAYVQFGNAEMALAAAAIPVGAAVLIGVLLQAALLGRAARMNAPVVFIALLFWGMMWGAWGLLLAMPIMVALKSVCDRVEGLEGVSELLAGNEKAAWT